MASQSPILPLAMTLGEPAGIGPDIALAVWMARTKLHIPPFYLIGDAAFLTSRARRLGYTVPIVETAPAEATRLFPNALPVVPIGFPIDDRPGDPSQSTVQAVVGSIDRAVEDVFEGRAAAIVTCPISKNVLYGGGFAFPGHTEYLAELALRRTGEKRHPVMMLAGPDLLVVPVTIHIPLAEVASALTQDMIVETGRIVGNALKAQFGIPRPRLAIAGLNPHAGEGGTIGREDEEIVRPAVEALRSEGFEVAGPLPADTMFHSRARSTYDAALCMYHDQALIPAKTLGFDDAVNVTLGLPFIRTSPDHGTAFELVGSGKALPDSLIAALKLAAKMAARSTQ
ncbi:4-hydroxythreonine-4-phosphate dehydrogenase PdxA [Pseudaminobacter sp. 19-2017]|uniref:4-hydroxythreonine-4-phosphate dehydrogenase n=1 Tax=Pseudaminobacter soli (ex Zhang et al. 2022) TaxID=2831468 RepID=A0A942IAL5_9HYPH|nr:4-hydroxythreonine-4-phosphate dehydrogenase PdxA [Pseudaminobacter soli]MBS3650616.1 4-hydroxythreonine-4-phosphate dehydrogenase PdxA [Pseudaminobacter soli]